MNPFKERKEILRSLRHVVRSKETPSEIKEAQRTLTCPTCGKEYLITELRENLGVCPSCQYHFKISARRRIRQIADEGSFREMLRSLSGKDPLNFPEYKEKLEAARKKTNLTEAVITGTCRIQGHKAVLVVMDSKFMMASMGTAVGEKITRSFEYATKKKLPIIICAASGGARMQEGILSLLQMAKTSAAAAKHSEAGLLYVSVMTNPTTGGVTASFASLGDITLAEPGALIGFAGARVIEQTIGESLPEGFQRAEFQKEHGFVDQVVERRDLKQRLGLILKLHQRDGAMDIG